MSKVQDALLLGSIPLDKSVVALKDGKNVQRIQIGKTGQKFKWGTRVFDLTTENFDEIISNFKRYTNQVPIDYNHLSMQAVVPDQAIAAGWFVALERDGENLYGDVEWTPKAAAHIENKEYRYISPTITPRGLDEQGNQIGHLLLSAAVTNYPFLKNMQPIALTDLLRDGILMTDFSFDEKRSRLCAALQAKYADTMSYPDIVDTFDDKIIFRKDGKLWQLGYSLSSTGEVSLDDAAQQAVANYVTLSTNPPVRTPMAETPNQDIVALQTQLSAVSATVETLKAANEASRAEAIAEKTRADAMQLELNTNKANMAVDRLIREGKVATASKEKFVALYLSNVSMFNELTATLPASIKLNVVHGDNGEGEQNPGAVKDDAKIFLDAINAHIKDNGGPEKMKFADAMQAVSLANPDMAEAYRVSFSNAENSTNSVN